MTTTATAPRSFNMNTADGLFNYFETLPTANLKDIAARPVWNAESARMSLTADAILSLRGER